MVPDLPLDVWLQIVEFIPEDELDQLLGLNSLFFHTVMKSRYKDIRISNSPKEAKRSLSLVRRLSDPFVGNLVESLSLRFEFLSIPARPTSPSSFWKERLNATLSRVVKRYRSPTPPSGEKLWFDEVVPIFPLMLNVKEFSVYLYCTPGFVDCPSFFSPAWSTFGSRLRKVSLGGDLDSIRRVLVTKPHFQSLEELSMEFVRQNLQESVVHGLYIAQDIIPILNDFAPRLQFFRLWCWAKFDLSSFLKRLGPFPNLKCLSLRGHFDNAFQNDGSGIPDFLRQMPKLRDLELRLNPQRAGLDPSAEQPLAQSLVECTSDQRLFKNLHSLQLYPTNRPEGTDILLNSIQRSSHTLTALTIRDRYLHSEEIARVISALKECTQLRYLRMNVRTLNVDIFDMLSDALPHLHQLSLYLTDGFGSSENMQAFLNALQNRQYLTWHLRDIGLWQGGYGVERDSMFAIAQRIPSIRTLWGNGQGHLPVALHANPFP
ncbi:hypothetical protein APHAL10511_007672 [Amanita phalloides]|nr:hypothetical protein APHAL10511_007672 [Amanita phalloides]